MVRLPWNSSGWASVCRVSSFGWRWSSPVAPVCASSDWPFPRKLSTKHRFYPGCLPAKGLICPTQWQLTCTSTWIGVWLRLGCRSNPLSARRRGGWSGRGSAFAGSCTLCNSAGCRTQQRVASSGSGRWPAGSWRHVTATIWTLKRFTRSLLSGILEKCRRKWLRHWLYVLSKCRRRNHQNLQ